MIEKRNIRFSFLFLLIIGLLGTGMRAYPFYLIPFQYKHILHAHSHVAFQGWIYTAMILLLPTYFLSAKQIELSRYPLQFKLTVPIIVAILITFSLQGYAFWSILVSTLFQLLNYWFIYRFLKDCKSAYPAGEARPLSLSFVRVGLWLGLLSTLAPYGIGVLSAKGMQGSEAYNAAVYFFLHFQYNGWFLFVAIGLLFKLFENHQIQFDHRKARTFFLTFAIAAIPGYALSLLGMSFYDYVIFPAAIAALLQLVGLGFLLQMLGKMHMHPLLRNNLWLKSFLLLILVSFVLKICLQILALFPGLQPYFFYSRNLIIAYIHLNLIGVISFLFIFIIVQAEWVELWWLTKAGNFLLMLGFLITEILLSISGFGWGFYPWSLLIFSGVMTVGIFTFLIPRRG